METCVGSTTAEASDSRLAAYVFFFSFFLFFFSSFLFRCVSSLRLSLFFLSFRLICGSDFPKFPKTRERYSRRRPSLSLSHRQKYTSHSKHIITNKLFIKMATSSTFIAQPNFLVKKNVFTVSQSRRASFFLCVLGFARLQNRGRISRETQR